MNKPTFILWGQPQQPVALESMFSGLKTWFKGSTKPGEHAGGARNPYRDGMGWAVHFHREIMATYGSAEWVQKHLHEKQTVPAQLAYDLSFAGVQFATPAHALAHAEKMCIEFHRKHEAALLTYAKAVAKVKSGKEEDFQKIKKPFPIGFKGPEFFGGKVPVVTSDTVVDEELPLSSQQMAQYDKRPPQLEPQDVVNGALAMLALVPRLEKMTKEFYAKSGWLDLPVDAAQDSMVEEYPNLTLQLCTDIGHWFFLITK